MSAYDTSNGTDVDYTTPANTLVTPQGTIPDPPHGITWWAWKAAWAELAADCPAPIGLYPDDYYWNPKPSARRIVWL